MTSIKRPTELTMTELAQYRAMAERERAKVVAAAVAGLAHSVSRVFVAQPKARTL
jgi:hypothetical protein